MVFSALSAAARVSSARMTPFLARSFHRTAAAQEITKVGVIGMGLMGHGIAQTAAEAGCEVVCYEMDKNALNGGMKMIKESVTKVAAKKVKKGVTDEATANAAVESTLGKLTATQDKKDLADCDLIIEAIIENMAIKKTLYAELNEITKPSTILASNTSSLPIIDMADASGRADRVIGLHYFNPVQLMKLVEVVRTDKTDPAVFDEAMAFVQKIGKVPVKCKDTPGFIVNRLLVPNLCQALLMLERGDASMQDIDIAMKLGAGHPMGPIQLADYVGLDTTLFIMQGWAEKYPTEQVFAVPEILKQMVAKGKLGRKTGQGFYTWEAGKIVA